MSEGSFSLRVYRRCLRLLPSRLQRHRREMEELFAEALVCSRGRGRLAVAAAWASALADLASAWPRELGARLRYRHRVRLPREKRPIMIGSDIRYALRLLARQKAASVLVAAMLALGIAANVAVFSLVNGLFIRPFPFESPDRLVFINEKAPKWNLDMTGVNFPDFDQWRNGQQLFDAIAVWTERSVNLSDGSSAERIVGMAASHEFDDVVRVRPSLGRMFTPE